MPEKVKKRHLLDYSILIPYLILCVTGLMMVYSSTSYVAMTAKPPTTSAAYVINQAVFLGGKFDYDHDHVQDEN